VAAMIMVEAASSNRVKRHGPKRHPDSLPGLPGCELVGIGQLLVYLWREPCRDCRRYGRPAQARSFVLPYRLFRIAPLTDGR
jgi:hypothetical protein